jgi:hypothetical protein
MWFFPRGCLRFSSSENFALSYVLFVGLVRFRLWWLDQGF